MNATDPTAWVFGWEALAAIGTLAAAGVALVAILIEARARRSAEERADIAESGRLTDARERESQDAAKAERHQADRIVAWPEWVTDHQFMGGEVGHWKIHFHNGSDLPAFDAIVIAIAHDDSWRDQCVDRVMAPGAKRYFDADRIGDGSPESAPRPNVAMKFRDAAGSTWYRGPKGELERANPEG